MKKLFIIPIFLLVSGSHSIAMESLQNKQLVEAAATGNVSEIERLLAAGVHVDAQRYDDKLPTPLLFAVHNKHEDACKILLKHGANIDATYKTYGISIPLLTYAIKLTPDRIVRLLITYGPRFDVQTTSGKTPLVAAALRKNNPICTLIVDKCEEYRVAIKTLLLCLNHLRFDPNQSEKTRIALGELYRNFGKLIKPHCHYIPLSKLLAMKTDEGNTAYDIFPIDYLKPREKE